MTYRIQSLLPNRQPEPVPDLFWQHPYSDRYPKNRLSVGQSEHARALVREFGRLEANWDGYNASPLSKTVTQNALDFLNLLDASNVATPDVTPLANGTVALEWQSDLGFAYLEIGNSRFSLIASSGGGPEMLSNGNIEELGRDHAFLIDAVLLPWRSCVSTINQISLPLF